MQTQSSYKVHLNLNTISNGELSDPLCNSVNRGLTLVRLEDFKMWLFIYLHVYTFLSYNIQYMLNVRICNNFITELLELLKSAIFVSFRSLIGKVVHVCVFKFLWIITSTHTWHMKNMLKTKLTKFLEPETLMISVVLYLPVSCSSPGQGLFKLLYQFTLVNIWTQLCYRGQNRQC